MPTVYAMCPDCEPGMGKWTDCPTEECETCGGTGRLVVVCAWCGEPLEGDDHDGACHNECTGFLAERATGTVQDGDGRVEVIHEPGDTVIADRGAPAMCRREEG